VDFHAAFFNLRKVGGSMAEVDSLEIAIKAQATQANNALDKLVNNLTRLSNSLMSVNTSGLNGLSNGVTKLSNAMAGISTVKTADFTRVANGITKISSIDTANLNRSASAIGMLGKALTPLTASGASDRVTALAKAISQLGYKSSTKAIDNIPKLAKAMKQLITTLSGAPKVSQNLIDMTNALAQFARTGASGGNAAKALANNFTSFGSTAVKAKKHTFSLASAFGKLYASYWLLIRGAGKLKEAINISSALTEVQNVVVNTFGQYTDSLEKFSKNAIQQYGISELTAKQTASRYQAMGIAMGVPIQKMSDMSIALTKLSADMASFYNVEQSQVQQNLQSIFTGETEPMRKYGIDLTNATLKEWALKEGLDADISSMTQMEKTMLRYQYVMQNTANVQGDFARTADTWANQLRILREQFKALGAIWGNAFINMLKPLVKALNTAMQAVIKFSETVVNALGVIFGWKIEMQSGAIAEDYDTAAGSADDLAANTGKAADNAKKLKQQLQGFDKLNNLTTNQGSDSGTGKGSGAGGATGGASGGNLKFNVKETESFYKSKIKTLEGLGKYIGNSLSKAMESIKWDKVYKKAKAFGTGLAQFLNGLISPRLFGNVGKTIAGALNTAIYAALSFGTTFNWKNLGNSIAKGINKFFDTFDFAAFGKTVNTWVHGIWTTLTTAIKKIKWENVLKGITDFLGELDLETVSIILGVITIKGIKKLLFSEKFKKWLGEKASKVIVKAIASKLGVEATWSVVGKTILTKVGGIFAGIGAKIGATINMAIASAGGMQAIIAAGTLIAETLFAGIAAAIAGWNLGQWLNEKLTGEKIDMSFSEQMTEIKNSFSDGSWKEALKLWGDDIYNGFLAVSESEDQLMKPVKDGLNEVRGMFSDGQFGEAMSLWGQDIYDGFLSVSQSQDNFMKPFKDKYNEVKGLFADGQFGAAMGAWGDDIKLKLNNVKDSFLLTWDNIKLGVKSAWQATVDGLKEIWNKFATWLNEKLSFDIPPINIAGKELFGGTHIDLGKIPTFASGGYVPKQYSLLMAGENGIPEIAGTVGGKTAVAGGAEITGIKEAILQASSNEMALLRQQNTLLQGILAKEFGISQSDVGKAARSYAKDYNQRTGKDAYSFA
jgi:hypothetical protein